MVHEVLQCNYDIEYLKFPFLSVKPNNIFLLGCPPLNISSEDDSLQVIGVYDREGKKQWHQVF